MFKIVSFSNLNKKNALNLTLISLGLISCNGLSKALDATKNLNGFIMLDPIVFYGHSFRWYPNIEALSH